MGVAIEANRQALKRIVASLVDMAGLAHPPTSPLRGGRREASGGGCYGTNTPTRRPGDRRPPLKGEVGRPATIPRILWRAILALLRPTESAARRLIIAAARGLVVPPPRPRKPKPQTMVSPQNSLVLSAYLAAHRSARAQGGRARAQGGPAHRGAESEGGRIPSFALFDPPRRLPSNGARRRTVPAHAGPRISFPGLTEPFRLPPPPSPDDFVSAERLGRRIAALAAALDDLPGQARRFARWKASRDAQQARDPATPRRISPIRRGRPPGGRLARYDPNVAHPPNIREVDQILAHAHALALYALDSPDTS